MKNNREESERYFCGIIQSLCPYDHDCSVCRLHNDYEEAKRKSLEISQKTEEKKRIRCQSPFSCDGICVVDMDSQQLSGGRIRCDMAEDMDFDRERILRRCEHAEEL